MYKICIQDEMKNSKGEPVSLTGGHLIEVVHDDVRDVPMLNNAAPGTGTAQKGLHIVNPEVAAPMMIAPLTKPGWGVVE
ncbi:hypothetical protein LTR66_017880 [Elasticomyces elasticus]|nr:hypothetical protein LTR66_017880 [Elasticomyces elasticus]